MFDHTKKTYRWWVITLLFCGTFVNAVDRGSLGVAAPAIMKELHLNPAMMGVVLSAFFWTYFAMNIPSGIIADRFGAKATLGWAAFVWSFLSALTGSAHSFSAGALLGVMSAIDAYADCFRFSDPPGSPPRYYKSLGQRT